MDEIVENVLSKFTEENESYKLVNVKKEIDLEYDIGNLLASDTNAIETSAWRQGPENHLKSLARDNTQLLINEIWKLPFQRFEDVVVVKLPPSLTSLPRSKPAPKARPPTKWEQYSRQKGIQKRKKDKLVWDETQKDWRPRWGYRRVNDEKNDWLIEVPQNADPNADYFGKKKDEKKERIAKNEFQRLRNIARNKKLKVPGVGIPAVTKPSKIEVTQALSVAKTATASAGRFTDSLPEEKKPKNLGKKRKFEPNFDLNNEKRRNLQILEGMNKNKPIVEVPVVSKPVTQQKMKKVTARKGKKKNTPQKSKQFGNKRRNFAKTGKAKN